MKSTLLFPLLLLAAVSAAQPRYELKTDLVRPFFRGAELALECFPDEQFSVEIAGRLDGNVDYYRSDRRVEPYYRPPEKTMVLTTLFSGKLYSRARPKVGRFFVGIYLRQHRHFIKPDDADDKENGTLHFPAYSPKYTNVLNRPLLRTALGTTIGYKARIGRRWLVEAGFGVDVDFKNLKKLSTLEAGRMVIGSLKAGYRL